MKITLEPTKKEGEFVSPCVIIETIHDDLSIWDIWDQLIRPALIGYGFQPDTVDQLVNKLDQDNSKNKTIVKRGVG